MSSLVVIDLGLLPLPFSSMARHAFFYVAVYVAGSTVSSGITYCSRAQFAHTEQMGEVSPRCGPQNGRSMPQDFVGVLSAT